MIQEKHAKTIKDIKNKAHEAIDKSDSFVLISKNIVTDNADCIAGLWGNIEDIVRIGMAIDDMQEKIKIHLVTGIMNHKENKNDTETEI